MLTIDIDAITAVLLPGGWHKVTPGSFTIGPHQFVTYANNKARRQKDPTVVHAPKEPSFMFTVDGENNTQDVLTGPVSSMMGVRVARR